MDTKQMSKAAGAAMGKTGTSVAVKGAIKAPSVIVTEMLSKYEDAIKEALPSVMTPERFIRLAGTAIASNPKMMQAVTESPQTLIGAVMTCAQLGLEPNTPLGLAYLLPFNNYNKAKGKKEMAVTLQLGYAGLLALARRSGEIKNIRVRDVYKGDEFSVEYGLDENIIHRPKKGAPDGDPIAYYAVIETKDGGKYYEIMWAEEVLAHAKKFSKSFYNGEFSGPWASDFKAMARKTVLIRALKYAPKATDFARDVATDNVVKNYEAGKDMRDVQAEDVIDVDAETVQSKDDAARAHELADDLGLKKGSDIKPPEGEDLDDVR